MRVLNGIAFCISIFALCFVIGGGIATLLNAKDSESPTVPSKTIRDIKAI